MGLDMYLNSSKRTNHTLEQLKHLDERNDLSPTLPEAAPFLPLREYEYLKDVFSIFHEEAYWRKFNALHNWLVSNVQDGEDECQTHEVTQKNLTQLTATLAATLETKDSSKLPPASGFFFGSTEVDEYYWQDVEDAYEELSELAANFDWEDKRLFYRSSW